VLVGNNHTADGTSGRSKIVGDRDKWKVNYMKRALQQAHAMASEQGIAQVLVAGDWNMTYELVEKAFLQVGAGEWQVSDCGERNDFIVANCKVDRVSVAVEVRAHDTVHVAQFAKLPLRHRGAMDWPSKGPRRRRCPRPPAGSKCGNGGKGLRMPCTTRVSCWRSRPRPGSSKVCASCHDR